MRTAWSWEKKEIFLKESEPISSFEEGGGDIPYRLAAGGFINSDKYFINKSPYNLYVCATTATPFSKGGDRSVISFSETA